MLGALEESKDSPRGGCGGRRETSSWKAAGQEESDRSALEVRVDAL